MSHVHNVAGQSNAAAEYHAYLEALRAARQARENDRADGGAKVRTFDSEIDTELDGEAEGEPEEAEVPTEETATPDEAPTDQVGAEVVDAPHEGLGKHYA
jgi:hypothetical protein